MQELEEMTSPCVCMRDFYWRRILTPDRSKKDPDNWVVAFGPGLDNSNWKSWSTLVALGLFNSKDWGVLLVTAESPELQLCSTLYQQLDCRYARTLSDVSCRVGSSFRVKANDGNYPFTIVYVSKGEIIGRSNFALC